MLQTQMRILPAEPTPVDILVVLIGLVILWIIVSIPVYIAAKAVTGGRASLGSAMVATLFGPVVYIIVLFVVDFFLGTVIGPTAFLWALLFAFIAWLGVYKEAFETSWRGAIAIAILGIIAFIVLNALLDLFLGITIPGISIRPFLP